jgi:hypothetical protein
MVHALTDIWEYLADQPTFRKKTLLLQASQLLILIPFLITRLLA